MTKTIRVQKSNIMSQVEKDEFMKVVVDMPWLYEPLLKEIGLYADKITNVLDIGCADGLLLDLIHKLYPKLILKGVDIDTYFIEKAKEKYPYEFFVADGYSFTEQADLIVSNLAFHHFEKPELLVRHMLEQSKRGVIICDQVRPETEAELDERIEKRLAKHNFERSDYYRQRGKESILEAYSKSEIQAVFKGLNIPFDIKFVDNDYFERFVVTILK